MEHVAKFAFAFFEPTVNQYVSYDSSQEIRVHTEHTFWHVIGPNLHRTGGRWNCLHSCSASSFALSILLFLLLLRRLVLLIVTLFHCSTIFCTRTSNCRGSFRFRSCLTGFQRLDVLRSILHDHSSHPLLSKRHRFYLLYAHRCREFGVSIRSGELDGLNNRIVVPVNFGKCN